LCHFCHRGVFVCHISVDNVRSNEHIFLFTFKLRIVKKHWLEGEVQFTHSPSCLEVASFEVIIVLGIHDLIG
jgi:hypothetical protein